MTTVLIVDDSKLARIVAWRELTALQPEWERVEAGNANDAVARMEDRQIDIAVIDYNMPGKKGLELAAELRTAYPTMPIAIITANVQNEVITRARELNVAFVAKPISDDALRGFVSGAALRLLVSESGLGVSHALLLNVG
jgi:CheY-like chemotaxis protein